MYTTRHENGMPAYTDQMFLNLLFFYCQAMAVQCFRDFLGCGREQQLSVWTST